ncbi:hypothetical protein K432DRAFT_427295 [Lepidopterella palustris CBS 459.81]|uniref:DASH complex subunit DUO1 n=1 Tax=Lepidopterella palustris CBS 459.81 TaxID=1314670 RepID=A0A8E2E6X2_9PEZI|nr:hypothetical protein K432DRAFT_427295 [Lepidopterella palustris CBS 459.81]
MDDLTLSDSDPDALFDTPAARKVLSKSDNPTDTPSQGPAPMKTRPNESRYSTEEARNAALGKELESVRNVNKVIEDVVESLQKAKNNMETVSRTVHNASTLLQTWTRILSQTEHNQRLILNTSWQGATQDLVDIENETMQRQKAAERREMEEQARREAAARKAEAEERRRQETPAKLSTRGRGRGRAMRGGVSSSSGGYVGVGGQGGRGGTTPNNPRAGSGIGRGLRGRGSGRGLG